MLNGEEEFADAQTVGLGGPKSVPVAVAGTDLDGDGREELLATLGESGSFVIFRGRASGGLGAPEVQSLRTPQGARATGLAVADVDRDGDRDAVAAFGDSATVLLNDGHGVLAPSAGAVTIPSLYALELVQLLLRATGRWSFVIRRGRNSSRATRTPGCQRAIYAMYLADFEILNGGFSQFWFNSSGEVANDLLPAAELVKAPEFASIFRDAAALWPGGKVPRDRAKREALLDTLDGDKLAALDERYAATQYKRETALANVLAPYIRGNTSQFVAG